MRRLANRALLIVWVSVSAWGAADPTDYPVERIVRYSFTAQNTKGDLLEDGHLWVYAPVRRTSTQVCRELRVSHPYELIEDKLGNQVLHFRLTNFPPYAVQVIRVEAWLGLSEVPVPQSIETGNYLGQEALVEWDAPEFAELTPRFTEGTPAEMTREIFEWVRNHVKDTGYSGRDRGALYALTQAEGDCTEYASLFVSLCRRQGIPARIMSGYVTDRNAVLGAAGYHDWAEYHDGRAWQVADPHRGILATNAADYVALRILGDSDSPVNPFRRYRAEGDGLTVRMDE